MVCEVGSRLYSNVLAYLLRLLAFSFLNLTVYFIFLSYLEESLGWLLFFLEGWAMFKRKSSSFMFVVLVFMKYNNL